MATMQVPCSTCGKVAEITVEQALHGYEVHWYERSSCKICGNQSYLDGFNSPIPENLRQIILQQEDLWQLKIPREVVKTAITLKILREFLNFSMEDIKFLSQNNTDAIFSGIHTKMLSINKILQDKGISSTVSLTTINAER